MEALPPEEAEALPVSVALAMSLTPENTALRALNRLQEAVSTQGNALAHSFKVEEEDPVPYGTPKPPMPLPHSYKPKPPPGKPTGSAPQLRAACELRVPRSLQNLSMMYPEMHTLAPATGLGVGVGGGVG